MTEMLDQYDVIEGVCGDFTDIYTEIATLWTACLRSDKLSDLERQDWLTKLEAIAKENKYGGTIEGIEPALDVYRMDMEAMTLMIGYKE